MARQDGHRGVAQLGHFVPEGAAGSAGGEVAFGGERLARTERAVEELVKGSAVETGTHELAA